MSDWKSVLSAVAPALATALGGPLAGIAVNALSQSVLGSANGSPDDIGKAISTGSPDIIEKVINAEKSFKLDMERLKLDYEKISQADRASARDREVQTKDPTTRRLAYAYTVGYFLALWAVWKYGLPDQIKDVMIGLLGVLTAAQAAILNYYFGSSAGSAEKSAAMAQVLGK